MQTVTEIALLKSTRGVFTRQEAAFWVQSGGARLDALLKRAVASNEVHRIHRGLYCLHNRYTPQGHPFEIAQRIHGPSYISLDSALSYHGWIPEAVHTITSVATDRSRTFNTPIGMFSFSRVPQKGSFFAGISRVLLENGGSFFMAEPLKALADYVYTHKCDWKSVAPLVESLRIDPDMLAELRSDSFDEIIHVYTSCRVRRFLAGIRKELRQ